MGHCDCGKRWKYVVCLRNGFNNDLEPCLCSIKLRIFRWNLNLIFFIDWLLTFILPSSFRSRYFKLLNEIASKQEGKNPQYVFIRVKVHWLISFRLLSFLKSKSSKYYSDFQRKFLSGIKYIDHSHQCFCNSVINEKESQWDKSINAFSPTLKLTVEEI